jgi:hypothetical protein
MDTMFQFGRKVVFTKDHLDTKLGTHDEAYYDGEQFITIAGQRYALRGRSKAEPQAWEYSELFEVTRDQVSAYHITTDYRDEFDEDDVESKPAAGGGEDKDLKK